MRETKGQVKRLERVFKIIGGPVRGKTCAAVESIVEEGAEILRKSPLDAGLLAAAQAREY